MTYDQSWPVRERAVYSLYATLVAFPIACFSLTLLTDLAYVQTLNLLWLHFSEWLLLAGVVFGVLSGVAGLVENFMRGRVQYWRAAVGGIVVILLAILNSLIHTADGWTAVMPYGLAVSVLTILAMILTGWLSRRGARYV